MEHQLSLSGGVTEVRPQPIRRLSPILWTGNKLWFMGKFFSPLHGHLPPMIFRNFEYIFYYLFCYSFIFLISLLNLHGMSVIITSCNIFWVFMGLLHILCFSSARYYVIRLMRIKHILSHYMNNLNPYYHTNLCTIHSTIVTSTEMMRDEN